MNQAYQGGVIASTMTPLVVEPPDMSGTATVGRPVGCEAVPGKAASGGMVLLFLLLAALLWRGLR